MLEVTGFRTGKIMTNTYVAVDTETKKGFIVDPGAFDRQIVAFIRNENIEIEYIILTHGHGDHIGGVPGFREVYPNAKIVAAAGDQEAMAKPEWNQASMYSGGPEVSFVPDITVADGDNLEVGTMKYYFMMTPGHTPGGMCIIGEGVCFSGDTLFRQSMGRTDFPGGSYREIMQSLRKLMKLPPKTIVYPGHMDATTIEWESEHNPYI